MGAEVRRGVDTWCQHPLEAGKCVGSFVIQPIRLRVSVAV